MANVYGGRSNSNTNSVPATRTAGAAPAAGAGKSAALWSTGLFTPRNASSKAIATVQVKEDVVLKAGSYINLYESDKKGETSPIFRMQVRDGQLRAPKSN